MSNSEYLIKKINSYIIKHYTHILIQIINKTINKNFNNNITKY